MKVVLDTDIKQIILCLNLIDNNEEKVISYQLD